MNLPAWRRAARRSLLSNAAHIWRRNFALHQRKWAITLGSSDAKRSIGRFDLTASQIAASISVAWRGGCTVGRIDIGTFLSRDKTHEKR
jgi:hypothetical protein